VTKSRRKYLPVGLEVEIIRSEGGLPVPRRCIVLRYNELLPKPPAGSSPLRTVEAVPHPYRDIKPYAEGPAPHEKVRLPSLDELFGEPS